MTIAIRSFEPYTFTGLALDPIHVGTGGSKLGRVDNTIVRDPVTRIPKIPGSSLAGVTRVYAAMATPDKYPQCAGLGQEKEGKLGHCSKIDCKVCTVFGFAKGSKGSDEGGGFAGLASFSDMQVLLFPVATQQGPKWITSPMALRQIDLEIEPKKDEVYTLGGRGFLNLGWLYLPVNELPDSTIDRKLKSLGILDYIIKNVCVVSDKLFGHIVNSNLEVRTSVAINPDTGAAEEGALFTYEALPRGTVLAWEIICRDPRHFKIQGNKITAVESPEDVKSVVAGVKDYMEHLGIGGMGSRGMGRLRVLEETDISGDTETGKGI